MKRLFANLALVAAAAILLVPWTVRPGLADDESAGHFPFSYVPSAKQAAAARDTGVRFRVLGGEIAADHAWPWQVGLIRANGESVYEGQFCGGSLVTRQWVLTAAHCVFEEAEDGTIRPLPAAELRILAGTNILQAGTGDLIDVAAVHAHPDYDAAAIDNDIALIELARPPEGDNIATVQLPTASIEGQLADGAAAIVTGWGRMQDGSFPVDLRQVEIALLSREECNQAVIEARAEEARETFSRVKESLAVSDEKAEEAWQLLLASITGPLTDNMVCSGTYEGGLGSCNGDSGGPLVVALADGSYLQVGIVSWGFTSETDSESCNVSAKFSAYTRVARFEEWIRSIVLAQR